MNKLLLLIKETKNEILLLKIYFWTKEIWLENEQINISVLIEQKII